MTDKGLFTRRLSAHADGLNEVRAHALALHQAILGAYEGRGNPDRGQLADLADNLIESIERTCKDFEAIRGDREGKA
jgi:hypothetical protein